MESDRKWMNRGEKEYRKDDEKNLHEYALHYKHMNVCHVSWENSL